MAISNTSLSGQTYVDFSYDADIQPNGDLRLLQDYEAIQNSLRLWLYSLRGERIRRPTWGGYVTRWLFKPMSSNTADNIQYAILTGLKEEFSPALQIQEVNVTPDYEDKSWTIEVKAIVVRSQEEIHVIENIRRIV